MNNQLSVDERATTAAILRTHAAMQEQRVMESTNVMARLRAEEPDASRELIESMEEGNELLDDDSAQLNRIADKIERGAD
jgi:hypothetical protein